MTGIDHLEGERVTVLTQADWDAFFESVLRLGQKVTDPPMLRPASRHWFSFDNEIDGWDDDPRGIAIANAIDRQDRALR